MKIKIIVLDVDGTMTDGKVHVGNNGELYKSFNIKDGYGIKNILPKKDIIPIVLTGRKSESVLIRCKELNIEHIYQGVDNKKLFLDDLIKDMQCSYSQIAYIGDDLNDLEVMIQIKKEDGIVGCPSDAVKEILQISDFVSSYSGGDGCVREFIEYLISNRNGDVK